MCGIVGYIGSESSRDIISRGLENLEYRGYDSAGVALVNNTVEVYKQKGTIDAIDIPSTHASHGIGHTRWSTHGEPSNANAHPHTDCTGNLAVVHNGIISNYETLKKQLSNHVFTSETDTEVVPHLIEEELAMGRELLPAVQRVTDRLEGSYAIAVTHSEYKGIVVARQDSPLVIGHGETENYVASDVTAFVEFTRRVSYLEDGDVALVTQEDVSVYNEGEPVTRDVQTVDWEADSTGKGGHEHFMHKEIHEQPQALRQALSGRIDAVDGRVDLNLDFPEGRIRELERIHIIACGTSYHAGLYAKRLFETYADMHVTVDIASEYRTTGGQSPSNTLALAVTQSGETADTLSALREASSTGMQTMAVTNTVGSTITREVDDAVFIRAGPEIGVAATKTFVSQVATLMLLAIYFGRIRETTSVESAATVLEQLQSLPGAVQEMLNQESAIKQLAADYGNSRAFFFIGRDLAYPVALEAALKLKEISYDHAEGFAAGELKHGPLALVNGETPVIAILTEGTNASETLSNVKEVESRGAPVLGFSTIADSESYCTETVAVPDAGIAESLIANVGLQLFAYHVADQKDRNIDKPRNLAKSVTVK